MKKKIAVIAAHLGCGATMAKHIQAGDEVSVLIMAEGIKYPKIYGSILIALRAMGINPDEIE
ncbi:secreted protein [Candidatus Thiomargarita nelsonii]|uniref:Secreted protein n=1 Tax=Candidatus Thiomargarita nelsonii TaxID=1003181 RepID=A0A0A6RI21_9GAMM|nr:secreted protein [Candidatus Thiomargarita nelsonii]